MKTKAERDAALRAVLDVFDGDIDEVQKALAVLPKSAEPKQVKLSEKKPNVSGKLIVVELKAVTKEYKLGRTKVSAVNGVDLAIHQGEIVALTGPSGSGKSTVLNLIGGLDKPSSGAVLIDGTDLKQMKDRELSNYRNQKIGFVFQFFYLQPFLNLQTNVEVPSMFNGSKRATRHDHSAALINAVGLNDRLKHLPRELSGGQMQRAAIARALMNKPKILLADEPTGNLDSTNAQAIIDQFLAVRKEYDTTVIIVTHDPNIAAQADRIIELKDGQVA